MHRTILTLARHEDDFIVVPLDNRLVADGDMVLPLDLVLGCVHALVPTAEAHDQERLVVSDHQVPLALAPKVLEGLGLENAIF